MKFFSLILCLVGLAFSANVIKYVGSSLISQEDANDIAISGVAKQIVADISTSEEIVVEDVSRGSTSVSQEKYFSRQRVQSEITMKWIKVEILPKNGKEFKALAILNVDEVVTAMMVRMDELRAEIDTHEKNGMSALAVRNYKKASDELIVAIPKVFFYNEMLDDLCRLTPLKKSLKLNHRLHELEDQLIAKLSSVRLIIDGDSERFEDGTFFFDAKVTDEGGDVKGMPVVVTQGPRVLMSKQSQKDGIVHFELNKFSSKKGGIVLLCLIDLPEGLLKKSGLSDGVIIRYSENVTQNREESEKDVFYLKCSYQENVCNVIRTFLQKKGVVLSDDDAQNPLTVSFEKNIQNKMKKFDTELITYNFVMSLYGEGISFNKSVTGVGKSEIEALIKALSKIKSIN